MIKQVNRKINRKAGFFFKEELLFSPAYVNLSKSARVLLQCLIFQLNYSTSKKRKRYFHYYNNGEVSYPESTFKKEFGYSSQTYLNARNKLIKHGLIKMTYRGGFSRGDCARYKILVTSDLLDSEYRWKKFPNISWEHEIPEQKDYVPGKETRFKSKPTLSSLGDK